MVTRKESMEATPRKDACDGKYFCSSPRGYPIRSCFIYQLLFLHCNVKDNEIEAPRSKKARKGQRLNVRPRGGSRQTEALLERHAGSTKVDLESYFFLFAWTRLLAPCVDMFSTSMLVRHCFFSNISKVHYCSVFIPITLSRYSQARQTYHGKGRK